ncbi:hypothetical protein WG906_03575 [Pedobacter sp. P351]|uniref:hypothetical protein n=1 Tax=Pedobacter superstes TaxID=3133441 RepID=UPI0030AFAB9D
MKSNGQFMTKLFLISLFVFIGIQVKAQRPMDWAFKLNLIDFKAEYSAPKGFRELDSMTSTYCMGNHKDLFQYSLIDKKNEIAIRFFMNRIVHQSAAQIESIKHMFNLSSVTLPNENYLRIIYLELQGDTANRITYYPKTYAKKTFNADAVGEYDKECNTVYKGKFYKSRVVFLHKEDVGDCSIHYFYKEGKEKKAKKAIAKTAGMFKFQ